jgi:hypothetical protein
VADVTVADAPLMDTAFFESVVLKFVPVIVTDVPVTALVGVKLAMVGGGAVIVKLALLVAVLPATVTLILPVVAPVGTVATS